MYLYERLNYALFALLLCTGFLCFDVLFGIAFGLCFGTAVLLKDKIPWRGIPIRISRPFITLFCLGYFPFLGFWGNFTQFTGLPRLSAPDAFWFLNIYTFLLELFLIFSQKNDFIRSFLFLIASEQLISGIVFYPQTSSVLLFIPALWLALVVLHLQAELMQMKNAYRLETMSLCEHLIAQFSSKKNEAKIGNRRTPVSLGKAGEEEIRFRLRLYPVEVLRRKQTLQFRSRAEEMNVVPVWENNGTENEFSYGSRKLRAQSANEHKKTSIFFPATGKQAARWTLFSVLFGLVFFVSAYRPAHFRGGNFGWNVPAAIGYSETSRLGDIGPQLSDPTPFFWLRLYEDDGSKKWNIPFNPARNSGCSSSGTSEPFRNHAPIYLRGAVFDAYRDCTWESSSSMRGINPTCARHRTNLAHDALYFDPEIIQKDGLIRMEETFEPTTEQTFFACWPCFIPPENYDSPTKFGTKKEKITFEENDPLPGVPYSMLTYGFQKSYEGSSEWTPCMARVQNSEYRHSPSPAFFPVLLSTAREWGDAYWLRALETGETPTTRELAREMCRRLAQSPRFHYSTAPVRRDRTLDPVEDFIRNHPQGHCEFFAAALTLMLRAQGAQTRYVLGFTTQEYSPIAGAWVVRHQDAHAWVEVWIPPNEIPENVITSASVPESFWEHGAWLRLDPTSGNLLAEREKTRGPLFTIQDAFQTFWQNYVLNLNFRAQQEWIYTPVMNFMRFLRRPSVLRTGICLLIFSLLCFSWIRISRSRKNGARKMNKIRKNQKESERLRKPQSTSEDAQPLLKSPEIADVLKHRRTHEVAFYHELEAELAAQGLSRRPEETSLEFMRSAEVKTGRKDLVMLTWEYYVQRFRKNNKPE